MVEERRQLEVSLEKVMLTVVALSFASMICVPLIECGVRQAHDQYAYSQFETLINSIDGGIGIVMNSTGQKAFQEDVYVPSTVTISSSENRVTYCFKSDSMATTINKEYPLNVNLSFSYPAGWYTVNIRLENSTWIIVSFAQTADG